MTLGVLICPSGVPALAADLHVTGSIEGQEKIASPFQMVAPQLHLPNHKIIDLVRKSHVFCDRSAGVFAGDRERIIDCASNIESLISAGLSGDEFVKNILDDNASAVEAIIFGDYPLDASITLGHIRDSKGCPLCPSKSSPSASSLPDSRMMTLA